VKRESRHQIRRNTSLLAPLTPAATLPRSEPKVKPDVQVEEILFRSYLREKQRADRLLLEVKRLKAIARNVNAWRLIARLKFKPGPPAVQEEVKQ
jgi:hypothetical protein